MPEVERRFGQAGAGGYDRLGCGHGNGDDGSESGLATMFGGLLSVRIKAAERALRDGRLDDALRMAEEAEIAGHARGGKLRHDLGRALLERARAHYRAERFTEALLDLGKAERCGAAEGEVAELRAQVTVVAREVARQDADRRRRVEQAQRHVAGGSLAAGKQMLQSVAGDVEVERMRQDIQKREQRVQDLLAQAESLLAQQRVEAAADHLQRAMAIDAHHAAALRLESKICAQAHQEARAAFAGGRLQRARAELAVLGQLGRSDDARADLDELLTCAEDASRALLAGQFDEVRQRLRRLQSLAPEVAWIQEAAEHAARLDSALLALRSGPLADGFRPAAGKGADALGETLPMPRATPAAGAPADSLPTSLLLLIDGGGSYLVHRGQRLSVGRAATSDPADLPIYSDLSARHAEVMRVEDDYFLLGAHEVEVDGRPARQQLLRDGDRVVLARRAKFTLRMPSRRSPSARIDLSDSTKTPHDVRSVILFKHTAIIGRGSDCHITCHSARCNLVLYERGGRLFVRSQGGSEREAAAVVPGRPVEIEGASFSVQPWPVSGPGVPRVA